MKKYIFYLIIISISGLLSCNQREQKPNVIFFLIDDLGWMDLSYQGSEIYESPNIDKLASESMVFTNAYAAHPRCVPSRYAIMTGNYPARGGVPAERTHLDDNDQTFGQFLKPAGYASCYIGKWHLGSGNNGPVGKGFDKSFAAGEAGSPRNFFAPYNAHHDKSWKKNKAPIPDVDEAPEGEYLNDRLTNEAINFIEENKSKPFFLMMAHYAVHEPLEAPVDLVKKYQRKIGEYSFKGPEYIKEGTGRTKMWQDNPKYAGMIDNLDQNIGKILDFLKQNGLDENTIIIFTSDHGGLSNDGLNQRFLATSNYPLRAGKGWLYEGGVRVPLYIKWPGVTQPNIDTQTIVSGIDFYPTIAEMVSGKKVASDGISLVEPLKGHPVHDRTVFWYSPKSRPRNTGDSNSISVRSGKYKLIEWYETNRLEFYDLNEDIEEKNDLTAAQKVKKEELKLLIENWKKEVDIE